MAILIDTNIALYFLGGDEKLVDLLDNQIVHLSFITQLELLAYKKNSEDEEKRIKSFLNDCIIIDINNSIKQHTIKIRKKSGLKLPDAIIAATAQSELMPLFSADKAFSKTSNLQLITYEL